MAQTSVSSGMADSDIIAMKETLRAQQQLLQKLYADLDEEREASATAASEAMDMILRLQGEKAAVKMEASHYKRMAEEKIDHAETTLEIYEELINQKEMEIAALEFQIQAYKRKLLSMECDINSSEFEFPENLMLQRCDEHYGESCESIRRLSSLPPIPLKNSRATRKRDRSPSPVPNLFPRTMEQTQQRTDHQEVISFSQTSDFEKKSVDSSHETLDSYWNQIKRLDEKVKVMSNCKDFGGQRRTSLRSRRGRSCSLYPHANSNTPFAQTDRISSTNSDKVDCSEGTHNNREVIADPSSSVNVHDVFEVPQTRVNHKVSEYEKKIHERLSSEAENRLTKPDSVSEGIVESHFKYEPDKLRKMFNTTLEVRLPSPKDVISICGHKKEGMGMDCIAQSELHLMSKRIEQLEKERIERLEGERIERLERERIGTRQEITHEGDEEEQLRLLKEIHSQLKSIHEEMRNSKTQKAPPEDDVPLGLLQEAMLYFWI